MSLLTRSLLLAGLVGLPAAMSVAIAAEEPASPHTFTANVGLYSQYIYRGITQTAEKPAIQGGFDYSHASGFYVGTWASNVSWIADNFVAGASSATAPSASIEIDVYGGYKSSVGDLGYDVGVLQYWYPGRYPALAPFAAKPDTTEIYGALSYKWITGKFSYVVSNGLFGVDNADGSWYADLTASYPIAEGWTVVGHVGHQKYDGTASTNVVSNDNLYSYTDWKLGISKDLGSGWTATAFYTDTDANDSASGVAAYRYQAGVNGAVTTVNGGHNLGDSHFVVGLSRAF